MNDFLSQEIASLSKTLKPCFKGDAVPFLKVDSTKGEQRLLKQSWSLQLHWLPLPLCKVELCEE